MLIEQEPVTTHVHAVIINSIRNLLTKDWTVEVNHVYREANNCADRLAKLGHKCPIGLSFFDQLPACISLDFLADQMGQCTPRIVHL